MKTKILFVLFFHIGVLSNIFAQLDLSNNIIGYQEPYTKIYGQTTDENGKIYSWGAFKGALVIDKEVKALGKGGEDFFIAITDVDGNFQKAYTYGGENSELTPASASNGQKSILVSNNNVYLVLNDLAAGASIETSTGTFTVSDNSVRSLFLKIDVTTGTILFAKPSSLLIRSIFKDHDEIFLQGFRFTQTTYNYDGETFSIGESISSSSSQFFLKTNLDGARIWLKLFTGSLNGLIDVKFDGNGKIIFAFSTITENFNINGNAFSFPIVTNCRNLFLVKSDTELEDVKVKLLYQQTRSGNWIQGIDLGVESSLILFYFRDFEKFTFGTSENNYLRNHVLLEVDGEFELKQINTVTSFPNGSDIIRFNSIEADANHVYFNGCYFGKNSSSYDLFTPLIKSINVFKDRYLNFDANGPSKNIVVKSNLALSQFNVIELGSLTRPPKADVSILPIVSQGRYLNYDKDDEIWNPWIINAENQVVKGVMSGASDKAEESLAVRYLDDGSRIVLGYALGYTMLDDFSDLSIGKNKSFKNLFLMRIGANDNLIWYKRLKSTFAIARINSLKKIGNQIHITASFSNSATSFLSDIFILDDKIIEIESKVANKNADMYFVIDAAGVKDFSQVLFPTNLSISPGGGTAKSIIDENTFIEYNSGSTSIGLTIGSKTFNNAPGFYFSMVKKNQLERVNTFKLSFVNSRIGFNISGVEYSKENGTVLISASGSFLQTSPEFVDFKIEFSNGTEQIFRINKNQFVSQNTENPKFGLVLNVSWTQIMWLKQFGTSISSVMAKYLTNGKILVYGTRDEKYLNYADITLLAQTRPSQVLFQGDALVPFLPFVLTLSGEGVIERQKFFSEAVFNSLGNTFGSKLRVSNIKELNGDLYLIGSNSGSFQSDGIEIGFLKLPDALVIQMSSNLVVKNVYRIASNFTDGMVDCDIYGDKIAFVYSSQGNPTLLQGNNVTQNNTSLSSAYLNKTTDRNNMVSQAATIVSSNLSLDQINPLDQDENAGIGQYNLCKEMTWFKDADGDGFGNINETSINCEKPFGYVANALDCDDTESSKEPCPCPIRTFTADWASNAISPLNGISFVEKYGELLMIGLSSDPFYSVQFTNATAIKKFIANSNQVFVLSSDYVNPTSKVLRNNLVNQLLYLNLNLKFNPGLKRSIIKKGYHVNKNVGEIYTEANHILGGGLQVSKTYLSVLTESLVDINKSYESGKSSGYLECRTGSSTGSFIQSKLNVNIKEENGASSLKRNIVYPNPTNTYFNYQSNTHSNQQLVIYNSVGQEIERVLYTPNQECRFGDTYKSGMYYINVIEGMSTTTLRVLKK